MGKCSRSTNRLWCSYLDPQPQLNKCKWIQMARPRGAIAVQRLQGVELEIKQNKGPHPLLKS